MVARMALEASIIGAVEATGGARGPGGVGAHLVTTIGLAFWM